MTINDALKECDKNKSHCQTCKFYNSKWWEEKQDSWCRLTKLLKERKKA